MPEIHLCVSCEKPIYENSEQFVIPNKHKEKPDCWKYLHFSCHDETKQNTPVPQTVLKTNRSVPKTLAEVLEVCIEFYSGKSYPDAVKTVAKRRNIDTSTVADKCTRRINLNTDEFKRLLQNKIQLVNHLIQCFPTYENYIRETLS
ncbi:MAG: hypothetical protein HY673_14250 [Chloroflexi bacterium]|nr:hypothetical protein [Chloroflexota bacterium]